MIARLVITDGRHDLLDQTLTTFTEHCRAKFATVVVDDSGDTAYASWLESRIPSARHIHHGTRRGLAQSIRSGWAALHTMKPDYVLHLEDDLRFDEPLDMTTWLHPFTRNPDLAQVCLQRGPCNTTEFSAGSLPRLFNATEVTDGTGTWSEHTHLFCLQPNIYPAWVMNVGWDEHAGEREFTDKLLSMYPETKFAFLGGLDEDPAYEHVGYMQRSAEWVL